MQQPPPVPELLQQLAQFAHQLRQLLAAPTVDWRRQPATGEWSLTQVICHLRDVEGEVHQPRFAALIARENAFIAGATPDEWAAPRDYQAQDGPTALADFLAARAETVATLQALPPTLWSRQGRHAFFGPTSLHELLGLVVRHDEAHGEQITTLMQRNLT